MTSADAQMYFNNVNNARKTINKIKFTLGNGSYIWIVTIVKCELVVILLIISMIYDCKPVFSLEDYKRNTRFNYKWIRYRWTQKKGEAWGLSFRIYIPVGCIIRLHCSHAAPDSAMF